MKLKPFVFLSAVYFTAVAFSMLLQASPVQADSGDGEDLNTADSDDDQGGDQDYLPGEEVTTPSGKKMKVWSTRGPVPVSQAPQPFQDPNQEVNPNNVEVEADPYYNPNYRPRDSFEVPPGEFRRR